MNLTSMFATTLMLLIGLLIVLSAYGLLKMAVAIISSMFADTFDAKHRYKVFTICEQQLMIGIHALKESTQRDQLMNALYTLRTMHKEAKPADEMIVFMLGTARSYHGHPQS